MKVASEVYDIYTVGSDTLSVVLQPAYDGDFLRHFSVALFFHEPWIEKISILRRGDEVNAIGKIDAITELRLKLENCELKD